MPFQYRHDLKQKARDLRRNMTHAEQLLWFHLRRKQLLGISFFRQRPIGEYFVDFYAPVIGLVIEVDGGQHFEPANLEYDSWRSAWQAAQGLTVVRFDNLQVINETTQVLEEIQRIVVDRKSLPPCRPRIPLHRNTVPQASGMPLETPAPPSLFKGRSVNVGQ